MGNTDRIIRILIAVAIAVLFLTGTIKGTLANIALTIAGIFLITSVVAYCPLYSLLGIKTCRSAKGQRV